ncbi:MAG: NAD(P)H-hydrate dehydratase, partial [Bryobacterales bacterium]|nr:NAD(P)H-hydrate dehydratase [Bryobacterales bacterium]
VTFTAPKVEQVLAPGCDRTGELIVVPIGSPASLWENDPNAWLSLTQPEDFSPLYAPRARGAHKGDFGHVLVIGGAQGKGGAAAMAGLAALRAGTGLVTVAAADEERRTVTSLAPELMTQSVSGDRDGMNVLAIGPGLGNDPDWVAMARRLFVSAPQSMVVDADGLNALAGTEFRGPGPLRVLTPHPGEMSRLAGQSVAQIQSARVETARAFAMDRNVVLVLKGQRTVAAFPDGEVWINPTGTPAMATGGSGDVLTGLLAGTLAQFPNAARQAVLAAVWLHGRAGELAAQQLTEPCVIATDLLRFLPEAIRELPALPH